MSPRVVLAPDSFKGTLSAAEVAEALAEGVREARGAPLLCPVADGGEGTLAALRTSISGEDVQRAVIAPDGRQIWASYLLSTDGQTAVVETAAASGLHLIDPATVDAWAATSAGTGQLIAAAAEAGAGEILVGVGGSGFSDGGRGALAAIEAAGGLRGARLIVLCDVATAYEDAARVYGPQKGADPSTVERLTERLHSTAATLCRDPRGTAHTGAAGGLAGALWAEHNAALVSGIDEVLNRVGFGELLAVADLVITGEGRLDAQTTQGKVIDGITRWGRRAGVPVHAAVGQNRADPSVLTELGIRDVHEAGTPEQLRRAAISITKQYTGLRQQLHTEEEVKS